MCVCPISCHGVYDRNFDRYFFLAFERSTEIGVLDKFSNKKLSSVLQSIPKLDLGN